MEPKLHGQYFAAPLTKPLEFVRSRGTRYPALNCQVGDQRLDTKIQFTASSHKGNRAGKGKESNNIPVIIRKLKQEFCFQ